jgi:hypothetical protein
MAGACCLEAARSSMSLIVKQFNIHMSNNDKWCSSLLTLPQYLNPKLAALSTNMLPLRILRRNADGSAEASRATLTPLETKSCKCSTEASSSNRR